MTIDTKALVQSIEDPLFRYSSHEKRTAVYQQTTDRLAALEHERDSALADLERWQHAHDRLEAENQRLRDQNDSLRSQVGDLIDLSTNLDEHPDGYDGPCMCRICWSYAIEHGEKDASTAGGAE